MDRFGRNSSAITFSLLIVIYSLMPSVEGEDHNRRRSKYRFLMSLFRAVNYTWPSVNIIYYFKTKEQLFLVNIIPQILLSKAVDRTSILKPDRASH